MGVQRDSTNVGIAEKLGAYVSSKLAREPKSSLSMDKLDLPLSEELTAVLQNLTGEKRLLAVVHKAKSDTNHMQQMTLYARSDPLLVDGHNIRSITFETREIAELFIDMLKNPALEKVSLGALHLVLHEIGHYSHIEYFRRNIEEMVQKKKRVPPEIMQAFEIIAEKYSLDRLEVAYGKEGVIDALAAQGAIGRYVRNKTGPKMGAQDSAAISLLRSTALEGQDQESKRKSAKETLDWINSYLARMTPDSLAYDTTLRHCGLREGYAPSWLKAHPYLAEESTRAEVARRGREYYAKMIQILGPPRAASV